MFAHPKDGGTGRGSIAADALKYRAAVAGDVREDVDLGIIPGDEAAVVPDLFRGLQHRLIIAMWGGFARDAGGWADVHRVLTHLATFVFGEYIFVGG